MRRVKRQLQVPPQVIRAGALALGTLALAGVMTFAAIKYAPPPSTLIPLKDRAVRVFVNATVLAGLRLEALTVEGRSMTAAEDVMAALDVTRGMPILSIDVDDARAALEALPWVKAAQVERRLPNTVHVVIHERQPYALWQQGSRYTLVDRDGHPIVTVPEADRTMRVIVGADAPQHAAKLFAELDKVPELSKRVRAAVRVSARRWNVYLDTFEGGIAVRLPEDDLQGAWTRLAELERTSKILERDVAFIDLRLPDRLIVRLRNDPNAVPEKPLAKKKTSPAAVIRQAGSGQTT